MPKRSWSVTQDPEMIPVPISQSQEEKLIEEIAKILLDAFLKHGKNKSKPVLNSVPQSSSSQSKHNVLSQEEVRR